MVLVHAVLTVKDLRANDDRGVALEHRHLDANQSHVPVSEGDHPRGCHPQQLARRSAPYQLPTQDTLAEVDPPFIRLDLVDTEQEWFVIHVEFHKLGVRNVDNRLTGTRETVGILSVMDVPNFMESVDVGSVTERVAAFRRITTHTEITITN